MLDSVKTRKEIDILKKSITELEDRLLLEVSKEASDRTNSLKDYTLHLACEIFDVEMDEMMSSRRYEYLTKPRSFCYWIFKDRMDMTTTNISRLFNKHHSSVKSSLENVDADIITSPVYRRNMLSGLKMVNNYIETNKTGNNEYKKTKIKRI